MSEPTQEYFVHAWHDPNRRVRRGEVAVVFDCPNDDGELMPLSAVVRVIDVMGPITKGQPPRHRTWWEQFTQALRRGQS